MVRRRDLLVKLVISCVGAYLCLLGLSSVVAKGAEAIEASTDQGLHLIKSDAQSVVLELRTSSYDMEEVRVEGTTYHLLRVAGYAQNDDVGHPQLPLEGALLGIPPGAEAEVRVVEAEGELIGGRYNLSPVPRPIIRYGYSSELAEVEGTELVEDASVYAVNGFYPAELARITSSGMMRDQRFVRLQVYPFQYNPVTGELRLYERVRVEVSFSYPEGGASVSGSGEMGGAFEPVLSNTILNYESARGWRESSRGAGLLEAGELGSCEDCFKISIGEGGIYELRYSELKGAGVPVDPPTDPHNFHMYNRGEEIAIYVEGEEDGEFEEGEYILFYGEGVNSKYTDRNVYWLTVEDLPGLRMVTKPEGESGSTPTWFEATARVEEELKYYAWLPNEYSTWVPGVETEHWYWEYLRPLGNPMTRTYSINLTNLYVGEAYSATLRSDIWGGSTDLNPVTKDHHVLVYINDYPVYEASWDGISVHEVEVEIADSMLVGENEIKVVNPGDTGVAGELIVTDWFEITYRDTHVAEGDSLLFTEDQAGVREYEISNFSEPAVEAYDVTDPLSVSQIITNVTKIASTWTVTFTQEIVSPARYLVQGESERKSAVEIEEDVPSDLRGSNGAEYLIITHSDFLDNAGALADHRAGQGYVTMVVDVEDIYDEFSYGLFGAQAIREFLAWAYDHWDPRPSYVLLVGDGNYDPKDNLGLGEANYVPPYLACVDPFVCEIPSDNQYVCVSDGDNLPEMYIGRLPVKTAAELDGVIDKILAYEGSALSGWRQQTLFVADDPDGAGDFRLLSDYVADNYLPSYYLAEKVYYKIPPYTTAGAVTDAIIDGINEGRLFINYFGHGGPQVWGDRFLEESPTRHDLELLTNSERFPMVISMSCYVAYFVHPSSPTTQPSCLAESLLRAEGKGAVATWASAGEGGADGHKLLDSGFFSAVFSDGVVEVGAATTQAASGMTSYQYLIDQYVLFGDPATRLAVQYDSFLPLAAKQY